jgi:chromosome segregation ATPase
MADPDQIAQAVRQGFTAGINTIGDQLVIAFQRFTDQLVQMNRRLTRIEGKLTSMSAELDKLTADVQRTTDVEDSAIKLLQGLSTQIASLKNDPAALQQLSQQLNSKADDLAAAIVANTPSDTGGGETGATGPT